MAWDVDSLKEYVDTRFEALERMENEIAKAQQLAISKFEATDQQYKATHNDLLRKQSDDATQHALTLKALEEKLLTSELADARFVKSGQLLFERIVAIVALIISAIALWLSSGGQ